MAVLTNEKRKELWADFMSRNTEPLSPNASSKSLLRQGVDAIDQWISDNEASLIAVLPADLRPANNGLTKSQIILAFQMILELRKKEEV